MDNAGLHIPQGSLDVGSGVLTEYVRLKVNACAHIFPRHNNFLLGVGYKHKCEPALAPINLAH
eukprot:UC1_evm1s304